MLARVCNHSAGGGGDTNIAGARQPAGLVKSGSSGYETDTVSKKENKDTQH